MLTIVIMLANLMKSLKDKEQKFGLAPNLNSAKLKNLEETFEEKKDKCEPLQAKAAYKLQNIVKLNLPAIADTFTISDESCIPSEVNPKDLKHYRFKISFLSKISDEENTQFTVFARISSMNDYGNYEDPSKLEIRLSFLEQPGKIKERILVKKNKSKGGNKNSKKTLKNKDTNEESEESEESEKDVIDKRTTEDKIKDKKQKITELKAANVIMQSEKAKSSSKDKNKNDLEKKIKKNVEETQMLYDEITALENDLKKEQELNKLKLDKAALIQKKPINLPNSKKDEVQEEDKITGFLDVKNIKRNIVNLPPLPRLIKAQPKLKGSFYDFSLDIVDFPNNGARKYNILVSCLDYFNEVSLIYSEGIFQNKSIFFELHTTFDKTDDFETMNFNKVNWEEIDAEQKYIGLKKPDYYEDTSIFPMGYRMNKIVIVSKMEYKNDSKNDSDLVNIGLGHLPTFSFTIGNVIHRKNKLSYSSPMYLFAPIFNINHFSDVQYDMYLGMEFDCEFRNEIFNINYFLIYLNSQTTPNNLINTRTSESSIFEFWVDVMQEEENTWVPITIVKETPDMPNADTGGIIAGFSLERILRNFMNVYIKDFSNEIQMTVLQKNNPRSYVGLEQKHSDFMEIHFLDGNKKWASFDLLNVNRPYNYFYELKTTYFIKISMNSKAIQIAINKSKNADETRKLSEKSEEEENLINQTINNMICKIELHFEMRNNGMFLNPKKIPINFGINGSKKLNITKHSLIKVACKNIKKVYDKTLGKYIHNEMDIVKEYFFTNSKTAIDKRRLLI